jgi:hypothetical protein
VLLSTPAAEIADAVPWAVAAAGGADRLSPTAVDFLTVLVDALPGGHQLPALLAAAPPRDSAALSPATRRQVVRTALLLVVLSEAPTAADHARLVACRADLDVDEPAVEVLAAIAVGEVGLDLVRTAEFDAYRTPVPRDLALLPAYARFLALGLPAAAVHGTVPDGRLAAEFAPIRELPAGRAGRVFADFYAARGWPLPGLPGGVALPLTLHDWLHVYLGVPTEPLGEVEVGAFAAGCTRHPGALNNLLIVLLMFEYGMVGAMAGGPGLAPAGVRAPRALDRERGRGVSGDPDGGRAVADALLRGHAVNTDVYLGVDHLAVAAESLQNLRDRYGVAARGTFASGLKPTDLP